jgi:cytochrome c-type biogenesis protein CcmH/NrfG
MIVHVLMLAALIGSAPGLLDAQAVAQSGASTGETSAQADDAIRALRSVVAADPRRSDVWVQIADVEAHRGNVTGCVEALQHAVAAAPGNAELYSRLSQTYASAGYGEAARHAIDGALALRPGQADYVRARATLSTWIGDYRGAQDSYRQLKALYPGDLDIALALARVSAWGGNTDLAVNEYKRYLGANGSNAAVWLELAKAESWRGNYAGATDALEAYRARAGETDQYLAELAAVFATGGRPGRAGDLVTRLLAQSPGNYELNLTHTMALARQRRAKAAFESLDTVRRLSPDRPETRTAERVLRTLLGSSAEAPFTSYSDSDALKVQRIAPHAVVALDNGTQLSAGYERSRLDARSGSGLDGLDGTAGADYEHTWAGAAQRLGAITFSGQVGYAVGAEHVSTTYGIGIDARVADSIRFTLSRASGPLVVSPRTVGLGLIATSERVQFDWMPTLRYQVVAEMSFQELSDGNRRWEVTLSPRRTVARRARFNLDLGGTAYRLTTTQDLDHGYYDPRRYEYYAAAIYPYFKVRENIGLAMTAALGMQRDNTSPSFHFGGNVSGEATFGIYRPWVLKINGSATLNGRLDSGAFRGFGTGAALVRRF